MAGGNNANWGKKGSYIGIFFVIFVLFILMLIWVYNMNADFLPK